MKKKLRDDNAIVVEAVGGLGNQLFITFFGLAVSMTLKSNLIVDDKLIGFGSNPKRQLEVSKLSFGKFFINYRLSCFNSFWVFKKSRILRKILWLAFRMKTKRVNESDLLNTKFKFKSGQVFSGYFQDWFYPDLVYEINPGLELKILHPTSNFQKLSAEYNTANTICVHVRIGDYLNFPEIYTILPERYFLESINHLKFSNKTKIWTFVEDSNQLSRYYPKLFEISDKILDQESGITDVESFYLLASSNKLIVSNSTYSLWAGWFVEKKGFDVVVPLQLGVKGGAENLISDRWNRYNLETNEIEPKSSSKEYYDLKVSEFYDKFIF